MKIALYGNTLDSYVVATSLCLRGNEVKLFISDDKSVEDDTLFLENEPGLSNLINASQSNGSLSVERGAFCNEAEIHWVCFKGNSKAELEKLVLEICENNETVNLVLSCSLGVGTYKAIYNKFSNEFAGFNLATIPPFIREGRAIKDFESPELLLIGADDTKLISKISSVLSSIIKNASKVMFVSGTEAEFIRTSICSVLATRISLINEISGLAEDLELDINTIIDGVGADSRVGYHYLQPGCGFGGVTLPQEVQNLLGILSDSSSGSAMLKAVVETNANQKELLFRKFWQYNSADIAGLKVAIWGASFKANSSSIINSPIHPLIDILTAHGCEVCIYDPAAIDSLMNMYDGLDNVHCFNSRFEAVKGADALFIITAWEEFSEPDFLQLKQLMGRPVIFDGRNMYEPGEVEALGVEYFAVGRGRVIERDYT